MGEFKLYFRKEYLSNIKNNIKSYKDKLFSLFFNIIISILLVTLLTFIFVSLNERFIYYDASKEMFILSILVIDAFTIFSSIISINKSIFNKNDYEIDKTLPLNNKKLIFIKLIFIYIKSYFAFLILFLPIFIGYGISLKMGLAYYILGIVLSLFYNLFNVFIASLISFPSIYIKEFVKKHSLLLLIIGIILILLFSFIYYYVFSIFIDIISQDRIDEIFNIESVASFKKNISYFEISNLFITSFNDSNILFSLFVVLIGLISGIFSYFLLLFYSKYKENIENINDLKIRGTRLKTHSLTYSLIKKEFILLFRNSSLLFSYFILLLFSPLLVYLVSFPLKELVVSYIGELENIYSLLIYFVSTLLISFIALSGSFIISRENEYFVTFKTLPVKISKVLNVKYFLNISIVIIVNIINFLMITMSDLLSFTNAFYVFLFSLFSTLFLIFTFMNYDIRKPYLSSNRLKSYTDLKIYSFFIFISLFYPLLMSVVGLLIYFYINEDFKNIILGALTFLMLFVVVMNFISLKNKLKKEGMIYYEK